MSMSSVMMYGGLREHFRKPKNFFNYMPKKKQIDTSLAAFRSLDVDQVQDLKNKIIDALNVLGKASSEELAIYLKKAKDSVWKRCSDLKNDGKIYASDFKVKTKRGREARQWMLCSGSIKKTETRTPSINPKQTTVAKEKQIAFNFTN
jgi:uncharacterized protein YehS (DUF1456 family)